MTESPEIGVLVSWTAVTGPAGIDVLMSGTNKVIVQAQNGAMESTSVDLAGLGLSVDVLVGS